MRIDSGRGFSENERHRGKHDSDREVQASESGQNFPGRPEKTFGHRLARGKEATSHSQRESGHDRTERLRVRADEPIRKER